MTHSPGEIRQVAILPRTLALTAGFLILLWGLFLIRDVLFLIFLSFMVATALYPTVQWMCRKNFPTQLGILVFYLIFVAVVGLIVTSLVNMLVTEGAEFVHHFPVYLKSATQFLDNVPFIDTERGLLDPLTKYLQSLAGSGTRILLSTVDYLFTALGGLLNILLVLVLTFYMLSSARHLERVLLLMFPKRREEEIRELFHQVASVTGAFVRGQLILMTVIGVAVWLGLLVLGVPYAHILGMVAFLLEIVPMLGPVVAAVLGVIIALGKDPMLALWTGLFYLLLQQTENYVLVPRIYSQSVDLNSFWILVSILIGSALYGIPGVFIAVPVAVILRMLLRHFYIEGYLGRREAPEVI